MVEDVIVQLIRELGKEHPKYTPHVRFLLQFGQVRPMSNERGFNRGKYFDGSPIWDIQYNYGKIARLVAKVRRGDTEARHLMKNELLKAISYLDKRCAVEVECGGHVHRVAKLGSLGSFSSDVLAAYPLDHRELDESEEARLLRALSGKIGCFGWLEKYCPTWRLHWERYGHDAESLVPYLMHLEQTPEYRPVAEAAYLIRTRDLAKEAGPARDKEQRPFCKANSNWVLEYESSKLPLLNEIGKHKEVLDALAEALKVLITDHTLQIPCTRSGHSHVLAIAKQENKFLWAYPLNATCASSTGIASEPTTCDGYAAELHRLAKVPYPFGATPSTIP